MIFINKYSFLKLTVFFFPILAKAMVTLVFLTLALSTNVSRATTGAPSGKTGTANLHISPNTKVSDGSNRRPETMNLSAPVTGGDPESGGQSIYPRQIAVEISHSVKNFPLKVRLVEIHPAALDKVLSSKNVKDVRRYIPIVSDVQDGKLLYKGPSTKGLAYVIENPTDKPLYFFASPHTVDPGLQSLGIKFKCLCTGEIFRIRPKHTFVRVMELRILPQNRGSSFKLHHEIIGLDPSEVPESEEE
jgi:hypothetical protein